MAENLGPGTVYWEYEGLMTARSFVECGNFRIIVMGFSCRSISRERG